MNAGTKVFLAVVALLVGVMILYYGVFQTGDHPATARGASGTTPEVPAVQPVNERTTPANSTPQPVLRNDPPTSSTPPLNHSNIPPATDPLADFGVVPANNTGVLSNSINRPMDATPAGGSGDVITSDRNTTVSPPIANRDASIIAPSVSDANTAKQDTKPATRPPAANTPASTPRTNPPKPTEGVDYTTYIVKAGDTGVSIAEEWFGDSSKWTLISKANPMVDFHRLQIGQKLRLPPKNATLETAKPAAASAGPAATDPGTYIVKSGDTLHSIARTHYGDSSLWETIYDANKKTIGTDPGRLVIGMKLTIPGKPVKSSSSR